MEESRLAEHMRRQLGKGTCIGRRKGSAEPFSAWHRDIGQCWNLLTAEAVSAAQAVFAEKYKDDEDKLHDSMEVLDTISKMLVSIYADSIKDNLGGITKFGELYSYLAHEDSSEVYATVAGFFLQSFFLYMFTSMEMAIGLPPAPTDEEVIDYSSVMTILSVLEEGTRKKAMKEFMEAGEMPTSIDYSKLLKRMDPFLDVIKEDQQRQYAAMKRREDACKKKESDE